MKKPQSPTHPSTQQSLDDKAASVVNDWPHYVDSNKPNDLFSKAEGYEYAGRHLLLDCWQAQNLDKLAHIETTLRHAVEVSGATLLHIHLHHFTPNGGVSGVAVLAESHISIHTWPEREYAALDIFMCGNTQPQLTVPVFKQAFATDNIQLTEHLRGQVTTESDS